MKLGFSDIKEITLGAVEIEETEKGIFFHRFTKEQEEVYENLGRLNNVFAPSGVRLRFLTNSKTLFLKAETEIASSRKYFSFDVFVDGKKIGDMNNFSNTEIPIDYTKVDFPLGEFSNKFYLGEGTKEVVLYLPCLVKAFIKELEIDDNSFIKPVKPSKKLLCFGDSITQGYDAMYPSNKYASKLADFLEAEEFNKAIGGEIFVPEVAATKDSFEPEYITVAYGTNDWKKGLKDQFPTSCKEFFKNLNHNYPNSKIIAITPIWRKDMNDENPFESFLEIAEIIKKQTKEIKNVFVIDGFEFVPQDENLFADLYLHPNDNGFEYYFKGLSEQIKQI